MKIKNTVAFLLSLTLTPIALSAARSASSGQAKPHSDQTERLPNIVFILADDLGFGDLACYGHPYAKTPHIDSLAKSGTRFTRYYATGVTCQPSRVGFMTSRHPRSFVRRVGDFGFDGRPTITELLNNNGYATGHFGKWHIGPGAGGKRVSETGRARSRSMPSMTAAFSPVWISCRRFVT